MMTAAHHLAVFLVDARGFHLPHLTKGVVSLYVAWSSARRDPRTRNQHRPLAQVESYQALHQILHFSADEQCLHPLLYLQSLLFDAWLIQRPYRCTALWTVIQSLQ